MRRHKYNACWEYWDCSQKNKIKCPVYKAGDGKRCWMYTDNLAVFAWAAADRKFDTCKKCPWYKKLHPKRERKAKTHSKR